ncbi:MAG: dephospho-CoA kinase [Rhizobiaceae bacterium]
MLLVGLTGSIGMGKSTTLGLFRDAGVPVHSADESVHKLYAGKAAQLIEAAFPGVVKAGAVDRDTLSKRVFGNPDALKRLEAIVHPLVREEEQAFVEQSKNSAAAFAVIDIPLLYETGGDARVDKVIVVTAPEAMQRARVLARPGMNEQKFAAILDRQMPDAEKRRRADFVIDTGSGLEVARATVKEITRQLKAMGSKADRNPKGDNDA